ncbi:hypothetical protein HZC31_00790 [Candidatus Woesearchaeota archaeon]|nr:hypothetical protein [Candidatus Woesearchaeota archaeon]
MKFELKLLLSLSFLLLFVIIIFLFFFGYSSSAPLPSPSNALPSIIYAIPSENITSVDVALCQYDENPYFPSYGSARFEILEVSRIFTNGTFILYSKFSDTEQITDQGYVTYFDVTGQEICDYSPFWDGSDACHDELSLWNPTINSSDFTFQTLCYSLAYNKSINN